MAPTRAQTPSPPVTPDGRYIVVRGRLWRRSNPELSIEEHDRLVHALMDARRDVGRTRKSGDKAGLRAARQRVQAAKEGLGERGPVWWADDAPDYTRHLAVNTPYRDWYNSLGESKDEG